MNDSSLLQSSQRNTNALNYTSVDSALGDHYLGPMKFRQNSLTPYGIPPMLLLPRILHILTV